MLKSIFRKNNTQSRLASSSRTRQSACALFQLHSTDAYGHATHREDQINRAHQVTPLAIQLHSTDAHRHATHREGQKNKAHQVTPLAIQARDEKLQDTDNTAEK